MTTAPQIAWRAAGCPVPDGKTGSLYKFEPASGACVTCAASVAEGVPFAGRRGVKGIDNDTFSGHAEFARWGTHACPACAWLYGDPKRTHRGLLAIGDEMWWPMIGADEQEGRPRWRALMGRLARAESDTPMTGVLTTDPKPRLWPRMQAATAGQPGLYVHYPDENWSRWTPIDMTATARALAIVDMARQMGASKTSVLRGLSGSPKLAVKQGVRAIVELEDRLGPLRGGAALLVATLIA